MAYTVLARKYRSQRFEDVVGQDPIGQTLRNAINTDRVAHAYLFVGTRGVGKTTMARILAKALNCHKSDGPTTEPCCKCDSCVAINLGEDIDVIEIDGASNNGVEQVRELRQNAIYRPARSRFKIYIIDEVHMLTVQAFNALLKTLEEPPSHVKFIFATTEPNKVIPTIQSRCQRFDFVNISPKHIAGQLKHILKKEKIKFEEDLILPLAKLANGSMRDGLSLLDRLISTGVQPLSAELLEEFLGCPNSEKVYNLIDKIGDSDAGGTLAAIEDLMETGLSEVQIADSLIDFMRDIMVVKSTGADSELLVLTTEQRQRVGELAEKFDIAGLVYNITAMEKLHWTIKNSDSARALLDALMLRFALSEHFLNVDWLLGQLQNRTGGGIKKNEIAASSGHTGKSKIQSTSHADDGLKLPQLSNLEAIKNNWQGLLSVIGSKLGNGTAGLLGSARPSRFEAGVLTLTFAAGSEMQRRMCESNGRIEQIQSLLSEQCGTSVKVELEVAAGSQGQDEPAAEKPGARSLKKNELINEPAVRTVLMELNATITDLEES